MFYYLLGETYIFCQQFYKDGDFDWRDTANLREVLPPKAALVHWPDVVRRSSNMENITLLLG